MVHSMLDVRCSMLDVHALNPADRLNCLDLNQLKNGKAALVSKGRFLRTQNIPCPTAYIPSNSALSFRAIIRS